MRSPAPDAPEDLGLLIVAVGGDEHHDRSAHRLRRRVPEEPFRALVPTGDDPIQVFADDGVVRRLDDGGEPGARLLRLLAFGDVHQHVDAPDDPALGIAQRRRIGGEPDARAVGPLGDRFRAGDDAALLERDGHRALVVRHRRPIGIVELPGDTPMVGAQLRHAPGERDGGRVEVREPPFGVGRVDRRRERVDHRAEASLARRGPLLRPACARSAARSCAWRTR